VHAGAGASTAVCLSVIADIFGPSIRCMPHSAAWLPSRGSRRVSRVPPSLAARHAILHVLRHVILSASCTQCQFTSCLGGPEHNYLDWNLRCQVMILHGSLFRRSLHRLASLSPPPGWRTRLASLLGVPPLERSSSQYRKSCYGSLTGTVVVVFQGMSRVCCGAGQFFLKISQRRRRRCNAAWFSIGERVIFRCICPFRI
jgi:hypothetical protein